jgi:hypothetical protein
MPPSAGAVGDAIEAAPMQQPPNAGQQPDQKPMPRSTGINAAARAGRTDGSRTSRRIVSCGAVCIVALLAACSSEDALIKTTAGYPPVELKPSGLPTFAVGDSFTFDNPTETWTVTAVQDSLVTWRSSLGNTRKTVFEPFMPPVEWAAADRSAGEEQLTGWGAGLFPLKGGQKAEFRTRARRNGEANATPYEWKCYSGNPRKVSVEAGAYAAYPVFCRRNDGFTIQSFYAPEVNASLMTTQRKRPGPVDKRELVAFQLAKGPRIAAATVHGVPAGVALAAVESSVRPPQPAATAVADTRGSPPPESPPAAAPQVAQAPAPQIAAAAATAAPPPTPAAAATPTAPPPRAPSRTAQAAKAPPPPPRPSILPAPLPAAAPPIIVAPTAQQFARAGNYPAAPAGPPTIASPRLMAPPTAASPSALAMAQPAATPEPNPVQQRAIAGGFGVQIASYRDAGNVEPGWIALRQRHKPLLNGVSHVITPVDLGAGKGVYHRLIAGPFPARTTAEQLCRSIRVRGATCLVQPMEG